MDLWSIHFPFPSTVFRYNDFEFVFDDIARQTPFPTMILLVFLRRLVKGILLLALLLLGSEDRGDRIPGKDVCMMYKTLEHWKNLFREKET